MRPRETERVARAQRLLAARAVRHRIVVLLDDAAPPAGHWRFLDAVPTEAQIAHLDQLGDPTSVVEVANAVDAVVAALEDVPEGAVLRVLTGGAEAYGAIEADVALLRRTLPALLELDGSGAYLTTPRGVAAIDVSEEPVTLSRW